MMMEQKQKRLCGFGVLFWRTHPSICHRINKNKRHILIFLVCGFSFFFLRQGTIR